MQSREFCPAFKTCHVLIRDMSDLPPCFVHGPIIFITNKTKYGKKKQNRNSHWNRRNEHSSFVFILISLYITLWSRWLSSCSVDDSSYIIIIIIIIFFLFIFFHFFLLLLVNNSPKIFIMYISLDSVSILYLYLSISIYLCLSISLILFLSFSFDLIYDIRRFLFIFFKCEGLFFWIQDIQNSVHF